MSYGKPDSLVLPRWQHAHDADLVIRQRAGFAADGPLWSWRRWLGAAAINLSTAMHVFGS
jgi:hypothetical protein